MILEIGKNFCALIECAINNAYQNRKHVFFINFFIYAFFIRILKAMCCKVPLLIWYILYLINNEYVQFVHYLQCLHVNQMIHYLLYLKFRTKKLFVYPQLTDRIFENQKSFLLLKRIPTPTFQNVKKGWFLSLSHWIFPFIIGPNQIFQ